MNCHEGGIFILDVKIYSDGEQIEEIQILQTGSFDVYGKHIYKIVKPESCNHILLFHKPEDGYHHLLCK